MKTALAKVIFLFMCLAHTTGLCFTSHRPDFLKTKNCKLKTDSYSANYGLHGEDWGSTGYNPTPFAWLGGYGVQTLETDTPLRLYLTRHRVYSATLNRFLSSDPMGLEGGLNLYAYGEGNPMAYIDPLGLCGQSVWGAFWEGFMEGLQGGGSIIANTLTFGYSDSWGWTDSTQYQGWEYDVSRFSASVAQGALIGAGTAGIGSAARAGVTAAQYAYVGYMGANAFYGGYQIGTGLTEVYNGNYLSGGSAILGGSLSLGGTLYGANLYDKSLPAGSTVYRVWGGGSGQFGESWTTVNPTTVDNYRNLAGLPNVNSGQYMSQGVLKNSIGVQIKPASSCQGNIGGLPELVIPNASKRVIINSTLNLNPPY